MSQSDVTALFNETNIPTNNLVSHYKLDGNVQDSVGNNNGTDTDITYGGAAEVCPSNLNLSTTHLTTSGEVNKELKFDVKAGSGTFVWDLTFNTTNPISVSPSINTYQVDIHLTQGTGYSTSASSSSTGISDGGIAAGSYVAVRADSNGKATLKIDYTSDQDRTIVLEQRFTTNLISGIYKQVKGTLKIDYTSDQDRTITFNQYFTTNLVSGILRDSSTGNLIPGHNEGTSLHGTVDVDVKAGSGTLIWDLILATTQLQLPPHNNNIK